VGTNDKQNNIEVRDVITTLKSNCIPRLKLDEITGVYLEEYFVCVCVGGEEEG